MRSLAQRVCGRVGVLTPSGRCGALALALALALFAPTVGAQADVHPAGAHVVAAGNATLAYWVGTATEVDENVTQGEERAIWFSLSGNATRLVAYLNVTSNATTLAIPNGTLVIEAAVNATRAPSNVSFRATIADAGVVDQSYVLAGEIYEEQNGTLVLLGPVSGSGAFTQDVGALVPVPPVEPAIPTSWLIAGAAVLVIGGGALAYGLRQRSIKRRMTAGPKRSQVMREMELEQKLEKAKAPEQVEEIKQEIRAQEVVREKRRELQILEAKRADALKTLDLLKKRHEAGGLTKLQYDNMVGKKRADLERIDAEIAQMEAEDAGSGSSAA